MGARQGREQRGCPEGPQGEGECKLRCGDGNVHSGQLPERGNRWQREAGGWALLGRPVQAPISSRPLHSFGAWKIPGCSCAVGLEALNAEHKGCLTRDLVLSFTRARCDCCRWAPYGEQRCNPIQSSCAKRSCYTGNFKRL